MEQPLKIQKFGGMVPAWDDRLLPNGQAASSRDTYLYSGALTGYREPKLLHQLVNSTSKFAYRIPLTSSAVAGADLVFLDTPVDGDTVTLGEIVYTFRDTITTEFDILIPSSGLATEAADNFLAALTVDNGTLANVGVLYGLGTVRNGSVSLTANTKGTYDPGVGTTTYVYCVAPEAGAAFNVTELGETGGNLLWQPHPVLDGQGFLTAATTFSGGQNETANLTITAPSTWVEFDDADTDVIRSPVFADRFQRYYFASPSQPPQYNTYERIANGLPHWYLGVPAPGCGPGVVASGGGVFSTIGQTTTNNTVFQPGTGAPVMYLMPITLSVTAGQQQVVTVNVTPNSTNATIQITPVVYVDAANGSVATKPGEHVSTGDTSTGTIVNQELQLEMTGVGLLPGFTYWFGFMMDSAMSFKKVNNTLKTGRWINVADPTSAPDDVTNSTFGSTAAFTLELNVKTQSDAIYETRAYTYTWVTAYGEEGPPAPPTVVSGYTNGTFTITPFFPPIAERGEHRNIVALRIYRTVTSQIDPLNGQVTTPAQSTYVLVADPDVAPAISDTILPGAQPGDYPVTQATIIDQITSDVVANNLELPSVQWYPPPENLQGFVQMGNGMIAGWKSNEIWFCEPFRPHAWPAGYTLLTEYPIVGMGVMGQSLIVCTSGYPVLVVGNNPASMMQQPISIPEPCVSKGSIVSTDAGVFYVSINGLIQVAGNGQAVNMTETWVTREKWRNLVPSKNIRAIRQASAYFGFGTVGSDGDTSVAQQGFTTELVMDAVSPDDHRLGFATMSAPFSEDVLNVRIDPWSGVGLIFIDGAVYYYDFTDESPTVTPFLWKSKIFQLGARDNLSAMRVYYKVPSGSPTQAVVRRTQTTQALADNQYLILRVYASTEDDDTPQLLLTRDAFRSGELLRITSGQKADNWQFELEGRVEVKNLQVADSVEALRMV